MNEEQCKARHTCLSLLTKIENIEKENKEIEKENKKLRECVNYYANETTDIIAVRARKTLENLKKS